MYFVLSKTVGLFTRPSNVIVALATLGLILLLTRFARAGRRLLVASLVLVILLGVLPTGAVMMLMLEERFPPFPRTGGLVDGIIVLGGSIGPEMSVARGTISLNQSAERLTEVATLARRFPAARIVFTGGNANLVVAGPPEGAFVMQLFESFGIARARVTIEDRSRNTAENATFSKALVDPKPGERWLLVTSAMHMPRAIGCFRKAGFPVEAYPVDWRTRGWRDLWSISLSPVEGLREVDAASKEWVGLVAYWITGRTTALFPGPKP